MCSFETIWMIHLRSKHLQPWVPARCHHTCDWCSPLFQNISERAARRQLPDSIGEHHAVAFGHSTMNDMVQWALQVQWATPLHWLSKMASNLRAGNREDTSGGSTPYCGRLKIKEPWLSRNGAHLTGSIVQWLCSYTVRVYAVYFSTLCLLPIQNSCDLIAVIIVVVVIVVVVVVQYEWHYE